MKFVMSKIVPAMLLFSLLYAFTNVTAESMKLGDEQFAKELCEAWNESRLPWALGTKAAGGNEWINAVTTRNVPAPQPAGYQKIVSGRAECRNWPKFELVIERQADGSAKCISAGTYNGRRVTWQFLPDTSGWFDYAKDFGYAAFMSLWLNDMIGDMITAKANQDHFAEFFRIAGKIALKTDYRSGCEGINPADVELSVQGLRKASGG
jgi:hypothetical protein